MAETEQIPEDRGGKAGHDCKIGESFNQTAGIVSPEPETSQQHHERLQLQWKCPARGLPLPPNFELHVDKLEDHAKTSPTEVGLRSMDCSLLFTSSLPHNMIHAYYASSRYFPSISCGCSWRNACAV